ncbi:MAG: exodeoxyribonuclease VII large subunit [Christensenellales bacterium]
MLRTLSVTELSTYVSNIFEMEELLHGVSVVGEVSGLSFVRGNLFFSLKDENCILPCVMFGVNGCNIKEGDSVVAKGSVKYYGKSGKLNFYVTAVAPAGNGVLYQKFLEMKEKLEKEGIFDKKYKKPLPKNIKTIGVITSATGAVLHDIERIAHRRNPLLNIIVYPAKVQGVGAEQTICRGLRALDKIDEIDVVIIARGGGSIEDLSPFNTEILAREIVATNKPVVSAVGHETDFTICDFASSIRASTPSESAELVARDVMEDVRKMTSLLDRIVYLSFNILEDKFKFVDTGTIRMCDLFDKKIKSADKLLSKSVSKLTAVKRFDKVAQKVELLSNKLMLLDPSNYAKHGWVKVTKAGKVVKSASGVRIGQELNIEFVDGQVLSKVLEVKNEL